MTVTAVGAVGGTLVARTGSPALWAFCSAAVKVKVGVSVPTLETVAVSESGWPGLMITAVPLVKAVVDSTEAVVSPTAVAAASWVGPKMP